MDKKRKRFPLSSFSSTVLVCMVMLMLMVTIGVVGNQRKSSTTDSMKHITLSKKSLQDICSRVDFQDTCTQHLPFKFFNNNEKIAQDMLKSG